MKFWISILIFTVSLVFADNLSLKTSDGIVHGLGLIRTPESRAFMSAKKMQSRNIRQLIPPLPGKYDLSNKVSPPEDQGSCGSCWSFGITKALRSALMLADKDPGTLAFNALLHNCFPSHKQGGCNGGDFDAGESFLNGQGPWLESQDPYNESSHGKCNNMGAVAGTALEYKSVGNGDSAPTFQELADAISKNHMLVIDVAVCGSWGNYSSGIFSKDSCGPNSINHIINLVGYDCESSIDASGSCVFNSKGEPVKGDGYLIVMNNWGDAWGEDGYMRTRAHVNAVADTAMYFEVAKPAPTPSPTPTPAPTPIPSPSPSPTPIPIPVHKFNWFLVSITGGVILILAAASILIFRKHTV